MTGLFGAVTAHCPGLQGAWERRTKHPNFGKHADPTAELTSKG